MLGFDPLSGAPLSAVGAAQVPPPQIPLVPSLRRVSRGAQPYPDWVQGRTTRWPRLHHFFTTAPPQIPLVPSLRRVSKGAQPYPDWVQGKITRWPRLHHKFTVSPTPRLPILSRVSRGHFPPINAIKGRSKRSPARPPPWIEFQQTYRQGFRVADASLALFELFVGEDAIVDFQASGQPVATSPTLPLSFTPTAPGTGVTKTLHIVVRETNEFGLQSFNTQEELKIIDSSSVEVLQDPSAPQDVVVQDGAAGFLRVLASYLSAEDPDPADTWEIYVTEGSDPVPGVDAPALSTPMILLGDQSGISATVGPFTPGATAHVIVTALRSSDSARGNATVILKVVALPLALPDGLMFGGAVYEQR